MRATEPKRTYLWLNTQTSKVTHYFSITEGSSLAVTACNKIIKAALLKSVPPLNKCFACELMKEVHHVK